LKTYVVKINPKRPDKAKIAECAQAVSAGKLVAFPTETVYGIAANFLDEKAIGNLYRIKARPAHKPFTVHIADIGAVESLGCTITKEALRLAKKFWPGPLTMVLPLRSGKTLGFRMPANKIALELIKEAGVPVVAPSANLSGHKAPADPDEVLAQLDGKIDMLIDAGPTDVGVESTVIDMTATPPKILREGAIKREEIEKIMTNNKVQMANE
jgi:L-threonylcarbamoyladenylate synthase